MAARGLKLAFALAATSVAQDTVIHQSPPLPEESSGPESYDGVAPDTSFTGVPTIDDHVSQSILGEPADAFEGGHEQDREEVAKAQELGAGIEPEHVETVIQEARNFEHEHDLHSVISPPSEEEKLAKEKAEKLDEEHKHAITELVNTPGMENLDSETGRAPRHMGDSSATSPTLHGDHMHKDVSPFSPVPLYTNPNFQADLNALKYADGNYSVAISNIAKTAREAVQATSKVFIGLVQDLYTKGAPLGKSSLANRSGFISALYWRDQGEFKTSVQGIGCGLPLDYPTTHVSALEAEHMCNEMGQQCSGYSCNTEGERFVCQLCQGVTKRMVHTWRESDHKPFFALKSPDHMEYDHVVRRARQWTEKFASLQKETEFLLEEERHAMEAKFQVMLERRAADPDFDASNIAWKVRLDGAWREEQYQEANWYAELMKAEITRIDNFYNQVLNKITNEVNMVNDKEQATWNRLNAADLANHSSAFDCWMAIRGVVYDFTYLVSHHPNKHSFVKSCGKEVTALYEDLGHDGKTLSFLTKRVVGEFNKEDEHFSNHTNHTHNETVVDEFVREQVAESIPQAGMMEVGRSSSRSTWRDFTGQIHAMAARNQRRARSASLLAMDDDEDFGSVRPHRFGTDGDFLRSTLRAPEPRQATRWPMPPAAPVSKLVRRE